MVFVLALPGAYFIARQVARPLKQIAQAALQVGQGTWPQPLPESGAQEIVTVSRAFNQMSADLAANERERALVLAGISHDLRTPLARVRIAAELSADESLREGLAADVEQMDAVIQQFLDYARLDENEASAVDRSEIAGAGSRAAIFRASPIAVARCARCACASGQAVADEARAQQPAG